MFMAQHSQVPTFGNWDSEENVPYTEYFEKAGKSKHVKKMNPIETQDNTEKLANNIHPVQAPSFHEEVELKGHKGPETVRSKASGEDDYIRKLSDSPLRPDGVRSGSTKSESDASKGPDAIRLRHERRLSREEGEMRRLTDSPVRYENAGRRTMVDSPHHRLGTDGGDTPKRGTSQGMGSERSIEQSPLHYHYQSRIGGKGSGISSPSWERKGSADGLSPATPGRSRLKSVTRGDDTPDHSPAVPKFGDWDENNPASAEGFSLIFNKVREEKQSGAGKVPSIPNEASHSNAQIRYESDNSKICGCFPWSKK